MKAFVLTAGAAIVPTSPSLGKRLPRAKTPEPDLLAELLRDAAERLRVTELFRAETARLNAAKGEK